jgi:preprotein translocase subunit SecD
MKPTLLTILLSLATGIAVTSVTNCQTVLEIRPVVDSLEPGALRMIDEQSRRQVFVGGNVLFSLSDVDSATLYSGRENDGAPLYAVNIVFRHSLSDSMRSLTGHHIGSRLAIILDGKLLASPRILDPIQSARVSLSFATEAEAAAIARRIKGALKHSLKHD